MSQFDIEYSASSSNSDQESNHEDRDPRKEDDDEEDDGSGISSGSSEEAPPKKVSRVASAAARYRVDESPAIVKRRPHERLNETEPGETAAQKAQRDSFYKTLIKENYSNEKADILSMKLINKKYKGAIYSPQEEIEIKKAEDICSKASR